MKNLRKTMTAITTVAVLSVTSITAFAAAYGSSAEAAAGVTGKSLETVLSEREEGKTLGAIAAEAGKLKEFQTAVYEYQVERAEKLVEVGRLTKEEAAEYLERIKERQAACDGTGTRNRGNGLGRGLGRGQGRGNGLGQGGCIVAE